MLKLEREGIDPVLKNHDLTWADLGVAPCKLLLSAARYSICRCRISRPTRHPNGPKRCARRAAKILDKAQRKFLFEFQELRVPTGLVIEGDRMAGVMISRTEVADGKVAHAFPIPGSRCARR